jgi:hypothetical protein
MSPHFESVQRPTESNDYVPHIALPEHLEQYRKAAEELRERMTPLMQTLLGLTDNMALRGAATIPEMN